jgi:hypothetical protein
MIECLREFRDRVVVNDVSLLQLSCISTSAHLEYMLPWSGKDISEQ